MGKEIRAMLERHQNLKDAALSARDWQSAERHQQAIRELLHCQSAEPREQRPFELAAAPQNQFNEAQRPSWRVQYGSSGHELAPMPGSSSGLWWQSSRRNARAQALHVSFKEFAMIERARRELAAPVGEKMLDRSATDLLLEMAAAMEEDVQKSSLKPPSVHIAEAGQAITMMARDRRRHELLEQAKQVCADWVGLEKKENQCGTNAISGNSS